MIYSHHQIKENPKRTPGEVHPYTRLMGMFCWMGSHFHGWIDYNGLAFSIDLLEWGHTFSAYLYKEN